MKKLAFLSIAFMFGVSSVYGANRVIKRHTADQQITKEMKQVIKKQIEEINAPKQIQIPKFLGSDYGALATSTIPVNVSKFSVIYSKQAPADIQEIIDRNIPRQVNKNMQIKDVIAMLENTEKQIVQAGYPFIKVILPAQDILETGADIQVEVVSGFVEKINVDVVNKDDVSEKTVASITALVKNAMAELRKEEYLKTEDLNRTLLTLRNHYGLQSQLFINPGTQLGAFNLNVSTVFTKSNSIFTVKNNLGPSFSQYGGTIINVTNSIQAKSSSQLNIVALASLTQIEKAYYRMLQAGYTRKFLSGRELGASVAASRTSSVTDNNFQLRGASESFGVSYKVPLVLNFETQSNWTLGYDYGTSSSYNVNSEKYQSIDKTSVVSLGYDITRERGGRNQAFSIKLNRNTAWFGAKATSVDGIDSTREGANTNSSFVNINYELSTKVADKFRYILTLSGQHSAGASLLGGQKFSLMGDGQVRGFVGDSTTGDTGGVVNNAFIFKPVSINGLVLSPAIDVAYGAARLYTHTAVESGAPEASSTTLSVSTVIKGSQVEVGTGVANKKGIDTNQDRYWNFGVTIPFGR